MNLFLLSEKRKKAFVPFMSDLSCFTESTAVLKISCYFKRQISYYLLKKEGFWPIYVRFVLHYWKYSSFENITLFLEANILLLTENLNLFFWLERERRLLSHLCYICLALLKVQQFWKYHAFSGGKYPTTYREHELIFMIRKRKKAFDPFMLDLSCFTESTAVLKISR